MTIRRFRTTQLCPHAAWYSIAALCLSLAGCAAPRDVRIPAQKDLSVLQAGASRTQVLAELGVPVYTEECDAGAIDVFVFRQGYRSGVQAVRALGLGTANLLALGTKRAQTESALAAGTDMTVRVSYDETHHINEVSVLEGEETLIRQRPLQHWLQSHSNEYRSARIASSQ